MLRAVNILLHAIYHYLRAQSPEPSADALAYIMLGAQTDCIKLDAQTDTLNANPDGHNFMTAHL